MHVMHVGYGQFKWQLKTYLGLSNPQHVRGFTFMRYINWHWHWHCDCLLVCALQIRLLILYINCKIKCYIVF